MDPTKNIVEFRRQWLSRYHLDHKGNRMIPDFLDYPKAELLADRIDGYFKYHLLDDLYPNANDHNFPPFREIARRYFQLNVLP
jgi:hypothetical protein